MEKHLLTEINRMKGMMGLTLLSEQAAFFKKFIKGVTGVSDESAQSIAKSADEVGSEFGTALKQVVGGAGTYDDLVSYVSKQGGSVKSVDDIVNFVQSRPDLLKKIATSSDVIMKRAAESVFATSKVKDLFNPTSWAMVNKLLTSNTISAIDSALKQLEQYKGKNPELDDLIQKLKDRKSIAEKMKSTPSVKVVDNVVGKSVDNVGGKSIISGDEVISNIKSLFKDEPEIIESMSKVSKEEIDNVTSMVSKKSDSEIDNAFEKIKSVCGLNEAAKKKSLFDGFCSGSAKYTEDAYKGNVRMIKITFIIVGIVALGIVASKVFSKEGITIPTPNVKFGEETYENTPEGFSKWVTEKGYSDADIDPDTGDYTYYVNGTRQLAIYDNNTKTFN